MTADIVITAFVTILAYAILGLMSVLPPVSKAGQWIDRQTTAEAQAVAFIVALLFWPVTVLVSLAQVFKYLFVSSQYVPGAVWRTVMFLGRGVRDLLPKRKAKLPRAVAKEVDAGQDHRR